MRRFILVVCFMAMSTGSGYASGFSIYEASAYANGMLGAFAAYAQHVSTIFYNPSGLGRLKGLHLSGGLSVIAPRTSFRNETPLAPQFEKFNGIDQEFYAPNLYGSYEVANGLTVGLGVYSEYGLGTKWHDDFVGRGASTDAEIRTLTVNPAAGYQVSTDIGAFRFGAGLRVLVYGNVKLARAVTQFTPEGTFSLDGSLENPAFGYNLGFMYEPVKQLTVGFTYRSPIKAKFNGDADFENLQVGFPSSATGSTEIKFPSSYIIAVNIKPIDNLSIEADYLRFQWSSYDELTINFDQSIPALVSPESPEGRKIVNPRNYHNSFQIRIGAEYSDFGVPGLSLRAGIGYDQNPIPERDVDPTLPDADRQEFSAGLSYGITPDVTIDASYIFVRSKQREVNNTRSGVDGIYNTFANIPSLGLTLNY